ncbi:hypothetical protein AB0B04_19340 [Streptomyces xinghaiensis]|uniref:Uncharacterized protein n=2 Tax=Streptomyces TaxID=1883 RepID=A0A3R7F7U6_9ACTN|nr:MULTISPECIES: hypothetical protein [Streptomyces]KNE83336.1 hypothetical protein ADZ36_05815 [Streptomyces fradiae]OFA44233.1 hypothetical protein BEN35_22805 [Streptomyces fradiae]PQM20574.1 hypothetical protein Sfr7A_25605 [Streptomyces xinghaiensis]RKM92516.1 hypothetical protein SFRA_024260 [Streptomyces xinghaiensis]RNC70483.1 hypothetical protein DC095_025250 [Streptomyces xinghaiensis]
MTNARIIECTDPIELYRQYDGQFEAQPAYIELDLREGTLLADYNGEIGNAVPFSVYYGFERRYGIPVLTADAANRVMREIAPMAARILADWEEVWDGQNMVARLGKDAIAAEDDIETLLGTGSPEDQRFSDEDKVSQWDIGGATNGCEVAEYGITADTSDERLDAIEREILADLASCDDSQVAVCHGLEDYLRGLRDGLCQDADDS